MKNADHCTHPPASKTADGSQRVAEWCSACGSARTTPSSEWMPPEFGKSGKVSAQGGYPLPTKEQYVAAGYPAENYDAFMERELTPPGRRETL